MECGPDEERPISAEMLKATELCLKAVKVRTDAEKASGRNRGRTSYANDEDIIDVLEPYYLKIFEYELLSWNGYKSEWPQNRSWELFREWFEINLCDELIDLETEKIMSEKL